MGAMQNSDAFQREINQCRLKSLLACIISLVIWLCALAFYNGEFYRYSSQHVPIESIQLLALYLFIVVGGYLFIYPYVMHCTLAHVRRILVRLPNMHEWIISGTPNVIDDYESAILDTKVKDINLRVHTAYVIECKSHRQPPFPVVPIIIAETLLACAIIGCIAPGAYQYFVLHLRVGGNILPGLGLINTLSLSLLFVSAHPANATQHGLLIALKESRLQGAGSRN